MPRLITLILCVFAFSGIFPGSAAASRNALRPRAASASTARASSRAAALDTALAAQGPTFVAPPQRGATPHAAQRHFNVLTASAPTPDVARPVLDRSGANRGAGWALLRRGYHATGPPELADVPRSSNQLALPA